MENGFPQNRTAVELRKKIRKRNVTLNKARKKRMPFWILSTQNHW